MNTSQNEEKPQNQRIDSLDVLRGLAIVLVIIEHYDIILLKGIGVDLFFVLSAFLVSSFFFEDLQKKAKLRLKTYFIRRMTKILPSYLLFLCLGKALVYFSVFPFYPDHVYEFSEFPHYLFFYRNYAGGQMRWAFDHLWSVCAEEHFYLLLALFAYACQYSQNGAKALFFVGIGLVLLGILFKTQAYFSQWAEYPTYTHNRLDAFGWGVLLAYLLRFSSFNFINKLKNKLLTAILGIFLLLVPFFLPLPNDPHFLFLRTLAPIAWLLVMLGLYDKKLRFLSILKIFAYFSYNLYLWHFFLEIPVRILYGKNIFAFLIYLMLTLTVSILITLFWENRWLKTRSIGYKVFKTN